MDLDLQDVAANPAALFVHPGVAVNPAAHVPPDAIAVAAANLAIRDAFAGVNSTNLRLPNIWHKDITLWFLRVESEFNTARITSQVKKFDHLLKALDEETALKVKSSLYPQPATNPYDVLKTAVIAACGTTRAEKISKFHTIQLGDLRPSHLLQRMGDLSVAPIDSELFRDAFLSKLPQAIRLLLISVPGTIQDIAERADILVADLQAQPPGPSISAVVDNVSTFETEINALYRKYGMQKQATTATATKPNVAVGPCFFHKKFGAEARKCRPPCSVGPGKANGV